MAEMGGGVVTLPEVPEALVRWAAAREASDPDRRLTVAPRAQDGSMLATDYCIIDRDRDLVVFNLGDRGTVTMTVGELRAAPRRAVRRAIPDYEGAVLRLGSISGTSDFFASQAAYMAATHTLCEAIGGLPGVDDSGQPRGVRVGDNIYLDVTPYIEGLDGPEDFKIVRVELEGRQVIDLDDDDR